MYKLKIKREAAGLTQMQLSTASGVSLRNIQAYEADSETAHRDINKAAALQVYHLARAIGCDMVDILEV